MNIRKTKKQKKFREYLKLIADKGMFITINRTGKLQHRRYEVIINFELKKTYRKLESARRYIQKQIPI
jgi:hypothetical protein